MWFRFSVVEHEHEHRFAEHEHDLKSEKGGIAVSAIFCRACSSFPRSLFPVPCSLFLVLVLGNRPTNRWMAPFFAGGPIFWRRLAGRFGGAKRDNLLGESRSSTSTSTSTASLSTSTI